MSVDKIQTRLRVGIGYHGKKKKLRVNVVNHKEKGAGKSKNYIPSVKFKFHREYIKYGRQNALVAVSAMVGGRNPRCFQDENG